MATNPYLELFGLEDEEDQEEQGVLAPAEPEPEETDNPYAALFRGETPAEPEPAVEPPPPTREEPSPFARAVAPSAGSFVGSPMPAQTEAAEGGFFEGLGEAATAGKEFAISGLEEAVTDPYRKAFARLVGADPEEVGIRIGGINLTEQAEERRALGEMAQARAEELAPENPAARFVYDLANATVQMAPSIAVSYITRRPNAALVTMGAQVFGDAYARARSEGKNPDEARADGIVAAATELGPEKAFGVFSNLAFGRGGKEIVQQMLQEAPSEGLTSILQLSDEMFRQGEEVEPGEAVSRVLYDVALGAGMGAGMAAPGAISRPFAERRAKNQMIDALTPEIDERTAAKTALDSLSPERAQGYVTKTEQLPTVDIEQDLGTTKLAGTQQVELTGDVTVQEGTALADAKKAAEAATEAVAEDTPALAEEMPAAEAQAPAAREPYDVQTDYDNGYFTFSIEGDKTKENDYDTLSATESDDGYTIKIDTANVAEERQKQGRGTALYEKLFETAARKGQTVESADSITAAAMKTWQALKRAGHNVELNPTLRSVKKDGELKFEADGPVATITPDLVATEQKQVAQEEDTGIEVTELTQEQLDAELGRGPVTLHRGFYNAPVGEVQVGDLGAHFSPNREVAQSKTGETGEVGTYEANIEKPLRVQREPENGAWHDPARVVEVLEEAGVKIPDRIKIRARKASTGDFVVANPAPDSIQAKALRDINAYLQEQGYDAVVYDNEFEGGGDSYVLLDPARAQEVAQDEGIEVQELTPEELEAELAKDTLPDQPTVEGELATTFGTFKGADITSDQVPFFENPDGSINQLSYRELREQEAQDGKAPELLVSNLLIPQPNVAQSLEQAQEFERLSGEAPAAPTGPMTAQERLDRVRGIPFQVNVRDRLSSMANVADNLQAALADTAGVEVVETGDGTIKLRTKSGAGLTLTDKDVQALRYAEQGSLGKSGLLNYLRLKADSMGITWKGKKRSPNFTRTKTGKMARDMAREVILNINGTRVGIASKMAVLDKQWERKTGKTLPKAKEEDMRLLNAYLTSDMSLQDVTRELDLEPEIVRNLKALRKDIDILSRIMISEGMVPNELQFQIGENIGSYVRVQYAFKDMAARAKDPETLLSRIPEERRNAVANALLKAYVEPAYHGKLHTMNRGTLVRLAKTYGLTSNRVVGGETRTDEEGNVLPKKEELIIKGTNISLDRAPIAKIAAQLSAQLKAVPAVPENVMLRFLQGGIGGSQASMHGREKSAERARKLSRTEEQLKEAGFTQEEIALNTAFREMLMEHLDPISTVQQTVNTMLNHVASHRIVNALTELAPTGAVSLRQPNMGTGARVKLVESGDKWADVRVVDPVTGEDVPASDVYVRPEIRQVFDRMVRPNFSDHLLADVYRTFQTITKINLTAQNAGSHFRNARSSAEIAATRGYVFNTSPARMMDSLRIAATLGKRDVLGKEWTEEAYDSATAYLTELGILHDSVRTGSIKEILMRATTSQDFTDAFGPNTYLTAGGQSVEELLHKFGEKKVIEMIRRGAYELPLAAYRLEDEGPKMMAFMQEREIVADMMNREDLLEVMRGERAATQEEAAEIRKIDRKAAKKIRNLFPTYSNVPEFVKDLSANLFVTPFPSFNAEMIRNWGHDVRDMYQMAKYVMRGDIDPDSFYSGMDRKKVAKRLFERQVAWAGMGAYYNMLLSSLGFAAGYLLTLPFGAEPDEEDEITKRARELTEKMAEQGYTPSKTEYDAYDPFFRALMPEWAQGNLYQVVDFKPGESITVMDMSFTVPYSQMITLGANFSGAANAAIRGDGDEAARAVQDGVLQFLGEWITEEPLMEAVMELTTGASDFGELEGWERADSLLNMIMPGSQTYKSAQRLLAPSTDAHSQELIDFALGQRPFTLHFEKKYVDAIWPEKLKMRAASIDIKELIREAAEGQMSTDEFERRYRHYEEARKRAMARIEFINDSADILGFSKSKRRKAVAQSTLTGDNRIKKRELVDGKWEPTYLTPKDIYPENQRMDSATNREYNKWIREMRRVQRENDWR